MCWNTSHSACGSRALVGSSKTRICASAHEGTGEGDLLPLADAEFLTFVEPLAQDRVVAVAQPDDGLVRAGVSRGRLRWPESLRRAVHVAEADVLADRELILGEVLEDHAHAGVAGRPGRGRAGRCRPALCGPQLGSYRRQSSLTKVVLPEPLAPTKAVTSTGTDGQRDVLEGGAVGAGVAERHVLEVISLRIRRRQRRGLRRSTPHEAPRT